MPLDSWLPVDFELPDKVKLKNVLFEGLDWQIYNAKNGDRALIAKESLGKKWLAENLLDDGVLLPFQFGADIPHFCGSLWIQFIDFGLNSFFAWV